MISRKNILFFLLFLIFSHASESQSLNASFIADKASGCSPFTVHFTNASTGAISYLWQFGDGTTSTTTSPAHIFYTSSQPYHIILFASDGSGNTDTSSTIINVKADAPYFSIQSNACPGEVLSFSIKGNYDSDNTVQWFFGNGSSSNNLNPQYAYADSGMYQIKMIVNNANCGTVVDSTFISITNTIIPPIHLHPSNAAFVICQGDNFPYYYDEAFKISWDFGDGNTSNDPYPTHHYSTSGTYPVAATVTNECGNSNSLSFMLDVTNSLTPLANFLISKNTVCPNEPFTLSGYSTNDLSYQWLFDDNTQTIGKIVTHSFNQTGIHHFKMAVTNNCGNVDTLQGNVNVDPALTSVGYMSISPKTSCPNTIINFKAPAGFPFYQWTFGDNTTSSNQNAQHNYVIPGVYIIKLNIVNFCSDTLSFMDSVSILNSIQPVASFHTPQQTFCPGSSVNFINGTSIVNIKSYSWNFGDGSSDTLRDPLHAYSTPGIYPVSLIIENNCLNKDTVLSSVKIDASAIPRADFNVSPGTNSCVNTAVIFQNLSSDSIVTWDFGDGNTTATVNPAHIYSVPGNYQVKLIVTNNCGKQAIASKLVRISSRYEPIADIILSPTIFCHDQLIYFEAQSSSVAVNFLWSFGDGTQSNLQNPVKAYPNSGLYNVTLSVSNECGVNYDSLKIKINDSTSIPAPVLTCHEQSGEIIYTWNSIQDAINYEITFDNGITWIATGLTNTFTYTGLNQGNSISAKIRTIGACNKSLLSAESSCMLTTLAEQNKGNFTLYPNPFTQTIHIDLSENTSGAKINLTTLLGENVYSIEVAKGQKKITLDLAFLPPGIYLIGIISDNSIISPAMKKIIKL